MNATAEKTNVNGNGCAADMKANDSSGDGNDANANGPSANEAKQSTATTISTDVSLPNEVLERLFQRYSIKQRRAGLECFLVTSVLFDLWVIFVPQPGQRFEIIGMFESLLHSDIIFILLQNVIKVELWFHCRSFSFSCFSRTICHLLCANVFEQNGNVNT